MEALIVLAALLGVCVLVAIIIIAVGAVCWITESEYYTKIKYRHFQTLYSINPDKWRIEDGDYPAYRKTQWYSDDVPVRFGFFGTLAYWVFKFGLSRRKKAKKDNKSKAELIACFQKDIDKYKTDSEKYIKSKLNKLR